MKISVTLFTACILFMVWQGQAQNVPLDYRYKMRHPPPPHQRMPPNPQYMRKKMEQLHGPPRHLNKPRPIPMHLAQQEFISPPVGPPAPKIHYRPTPQPPRLPWKSPKIPFPQTTEKPFQSSQAIGSTHEFDYHIQTNNIPTNSIPIKQIGEKGPIHTIPAPNLSLADKPSVIEEVHQEIKFKPHRPPTQHQQPFIQQNFGQPQANFPQPQQHFVQPPPTYTQPQSAFAHQQVIQYTQNQNQPSASNQLYQVTEPNDIPSSGGAEKLVRTQQIFFQPEKQNNQNYEQQNPQFGKPQGSNNEFENGGDLSADQLYELLKPHFDQKPNLFLQQKNSDVPISFTEFKDASEAMFKTTDQQQQQQQFPKQNFNQQNQVFAYERHAAQNLQNENNESGFLTANYNFKADFPSNAAPQSDHQNLNSPYIQEVFGQQYGNGNVIELNGKPNQFNNNNNPQEETVNGAYYTTLENQQLGETLASLQALDQNNNIFAQNVDGKAPMEIYVADDSFREQENNQSSQYSNESNSSQEQGNEQVSTTTKRSNSRGRYGAYGSRAKPKQN